MRSIPNWLLSGLLVALLPVAAAAQEVLDTATAPEPTSSIKKIAISFGGGYYSGSTYFELPTIDLRAQVAPGSNTLTLFNGQELDLGIQRRPNCLDAPIKKIVPGQAANVRLGFYISDDFHMDLYGSYARSKAELSLLRYQDGEIAGRVEPDELKRWTDELYASQGIDGGFRDEDFRSFTGGANLVYDASAIRMFGLTPQFGTGFGGVINRFTTLEDKTALYFQLFGGLLMPLGDHLRVDLRGTATTFSFATEEVTYAQQVTMFVGSLGVTWLFDVKPIH
ncbi:MAG: hypothetical protein Q7W56_13900 [Candidatus Latescibacteria bacterium]|nr:hypothetical protein [Candidatus Latescibacterota bacterium]